MRLLLLLLLLLLTLLRFTCELCTTATDVVELGPSETLVSCAASAGAGAGADYCCCSCGYHRPCRPRPWGECMDAMGIANKPLLLSRIAGKRRLPLYRTHQLPKEGRLTGGGAICTNALYSRVIKVGGWIRACPNQNPQTGVFQNERALSLAHTADAQHSLTAPVPSCDGALLYPPLSPKIHVPATGYIS